VEFDLESLESRFLLSGNNPTPAVPLNPHRFVETLRVESLPSAALETAPILGLHLPVSYTIIPPAGAGNVDPSPSFLSNPGPIRSASLILSSTTVPEGAVPLLLSPANRSTAVEASGGSPPWGSVVPPWISNPAGVSSSGPAVSTVTPTVVAGRTSGGSALAADGLPGLIQAAGISRPPSNPSVSLTVPWGKSSPVINLPDGPFVTVVGALNPGQIANFYHVPLDGNTERLWFNMHAYPSMKPPDEQLAVFDDEGRMIADLAPSSGSTSLTVSIPGAHLDAGDTGLVLEVASADGASGAGASSTLREEMYMVQIARLSASTNRVAWGSNLNASPSTSRESAAPVLNPSLTVPTSAAYEAGSDPGLVNEGEPSDVVAGPVPTGPLPSRSAAPLGGVLGDGDPVPEVDRRDAVAIDLELIGIPTDELLALDVPPAEVVDGGGRLAEVRGSGGFPLLASGPVSPPLRPLAKLPTLPRRWASPSVVSFEPNPGPPRLEAIEAEPSRSSSLSASAGTDLTFAVSLVFGLLLPDLADAFEREDPPQDHAVDTP
jgi:hypothetical protein